MENLTAIVINFLRPDYAIDCARSLRINYPKIKIIVGEQIKYLPNRLLQKNCAKYGAEYVELPWDCGVGKSRNILIGKAKTDYILIGDDDFLYDKEAKVDKMLQFVENTDFRLVGGRILQDGLAKNYQGYINIHPTHVETYPLRNPDEIEDREEVSGLRFKKCDLTFNFFVIDKKIAEEYPWDENIKVAYEHHHFFIGLKKAGINVAFSPDPIVKHKFQNYPITREYKNMRMRFIDKEYYFKSLGIDYSIGISGVRESL